MVCTGACHLGGYIRDEVSKGDWIKKLMDKWERYIHALRKTAYKYPQQIYAAVAHAIQSE